MTERKPVSEKSLTSTDVPLPSWEEVRGRLQAGAQHSPAINGTYWLSTVNSNDSPHVMPLFGVWFEGAMYFTSSPRAVKARNIGANAHVAITCGASDYDLVLEGDAAKVTDEKKLQQIADVYADKYGWELRVHDHTFDADHGAPSSGPPPYDAYEVVPTTVFALGTSDPYAAVKWDF